jgi:hypothetical protein
LHQNYSVPAVEVNPEDISIILISEAAPVDLKDGYYAPEEPLFAQTTIQAFNDAGAGVSSIQDILDLGVYLTTAVKCAKTAYAIRTDTVKQCARILEEELALFPNVKAYLLMGDVAIRALNTVAQRAGEKRVIPAGSTYTKCAFGVRFARSRTISAAGGLSHLTCRPGPASSSKKVSAR